MKLLVLSDLHIEVSAFTPDPEVVDAADVVVLAGDIHNGAQAAVWARQTFADKPVVLVSGNHELYDGHWVRTLDDIREAALRQQVHFLENDSITIDGVQFLGTALWTDFAFFGAHQTQQAIEEARRYMADYRAIKDCSPEATIERHQQSLAWLEQQLTGPVEPASRVVVTHHYPHKNSTTAQYQSDLCTAAFGSQLPAALFEKMGLWIHGHTHSSHAYDVGSCQMVCNPRGYPMRRLGGAYENSAFNPRLLMEQRMGGRWGMVA